MDRKGGAGTAGDGTEETRALQRNPAIRFLVFERQPGEIQLQGLKHLTNRQRLSKNLTSVEVEVGLVQSSAWSPAGQTLRSDMVTAVSASVFIPAVDICHNPHHLKQSRCAWGKHNVCPTSL